MAEGALWAVNDGSDCEGRPLMARVGDQCLPPLPGVPCAVHEASLLHHQARTHRLHLQALREC